MVELLSDDERYRQFSAQALVKAEQMSSAAMARKLETEYREVIKRYHDQEGRKLIFRFVEQPG